jgi:hypothetical protein
MVMVVMALMQPAVEVLESPELATALDLALIAYWESETSFCSFP